MEPEKEGEYPLSKEIELNLLRREIRIQKTRGQIADTQRILL